MSKNKELNYLSEDDVQIYSHTLDQEYYTCKSQSLHFNAFNYTIDSLYVYNIDESDNIKNILNNNFFSHFNFIQPTPVETME